MTTSVLAAATFDAPAALTEDEIAAVAGGIVIGGHEVFYGPSPRPVVGDPTPPPGGYTP